MIHKIHFLLTFHLPVSIFAVTCEKLPGDCKVDGGVGVRLNCDGTVVGCLRWSISEVSVDTGIDVIVVELIV